MKINKSVRFTSPLPRFAGGGRLVRFSIVGRAGYVVESWGVNAADAVSRYQDAIRKSGRESASVPNVTLEIPWSFQVAEVVRG